MSLPMDSGVADMFIDVRVFNPYAPSNKKSTLTIGNTNYRKHEEESL